MKKEVEPSFADLKLRYQQLSAAQKVELEHRIRKRSYLEYKHMELIKSELLRLEVRRAQLRLLAKNKELIQLEAKIRTKKEKLLRYFCKQL